MMDLFIFDMDGVLIDVSKSYREAIRQTVGIYLRSCLGIQTKKTIISQEDISLFKSTGGFNNDWDLTSGLLLYLLSASRLPPLPRKRTFPTLKENLLYLRERSSRFRREVRTCRKRDLEMFTRRVKSFGGGLAGIRRAIGNSWDGWVYGSGDLKNENIVKRIFQEVYLGPRFFSGYHLQPFFYKGKGLYIREKLLIPRRVLAALRKRVRLGIASGRPRFEAGLALKRFRLLPYFESIVTHDHCVEAQESLYRSTGKRKSLLKPHPYSLLRVIQEIGGSRPRCAYVGDVVDDMLAARAMKRRVPMLAIGFLNSRRDRGALRESLLKAGADQVISDPKDLLDLAASKSD